MPEGAGRREQGHRGTDFHTGKVRDTPETGSKKEEEGTTICSDGFQQVVLWMLLG